jgi:CDP-diacylglycerol pyrophosphatase
MYESGKKQIQEVMVVNSSPTVKLNKDLPDEEDLLKKYDAAIYKMSRADFLMS